MTERDRHLRTQQETGMRRLIASRGKELDKFSMSNKVVTQYQHQCSLCSKLKLTTSCSQSFVGTVGTFRSLAELIDMFDPTLRLKRRTFSLTHRKGSIHL